MRSAEEHMQQAERYADAVIEGQKVIAAQPWNLSAIDIQVMEMQLHAAEVEMKLATFKRVAELSTLTVPAEDAAAEQRLGSG